MNLCDINEIKALLARNGFHFSKSLGQNFLVEQWVPYDIAAASGADTGCGVLEIGPGIGPLTRELSLLADKVVSVELDRALLPILSETLADRDNVSILSGDILKTDIPNLVAEHFQGLNPIACANLPYNITSPAIAALIDAKSFSSITVMIQREVAQRICARPGTSAYGAFSVYCQYHTTPELLFDVTPDCFMPAPKVTSSVIKMIPRTAPPADIVSESHFFRVVKASFSQRRKTLLNGLTSAFGSDFSKQEIAEIIASCELPADIRGERLGIAEFALLSKTILSFK